MFKKFLTDEEGQSMVEYAIIVTLIAVALIGGLILLRGAMENSLTSASDTLNDVGSN